MLEDIICMNNGKYRMQYTPILEKSYTFHSLGLQELLRKVTMNECRSGTRHFSQIDCIIFSTLKE